MKIEIEVLSTHIRVNGFSIVATPQSNGDDMWINYSILWKESEVATFENIADAIKYCQL